MTGLHGQGGGNWMAEKQIRVQSRNGRLIDISADYFNR